MTPRSADDANDRPTLMSRRSLLAVSGLSVGAAALGVDLLAPGTAASAAGTYLRPCGNVPISDSWQGHKNRVPASKEPGTDYSVAKNTPVRAATSGVIVAVKDTTSTATGRFVALQADDGNYLRYLHLNSRAVALGARVTRGQVIASSGASGFDNENGYGPHVHVSLWVGGTPAQLGFQNSVDFEKYVGEPPVTPDPEPEPIYRRKSMSTLYYKTEGGVLWALAGDGQGTAAWLETSSQQLANHLANQHGPAALLSAGSFAAWKARYLGQDLPSA